MYMHYRGRIEEFVAGFGEDFESLKTVKVTLHTPFYNEGYPANLTCLRSWQNLLEPLAQLHKVGMDVDIRGTTPDLAARLVAAMTSKHLLCVPKANTYGHRKSRHEGKLLQKYKLGRYYDSQFDWEETAETISKEAEMNLPGYRCCESCETHDLLQW